MTGADFELRMALPADARFAGTMRELASHAARYAGCTDQEAERYGEAVNAVVLECLDAVACGAEVPVILRRGAGPVEFLIGCQGARLEAAGHTGRITVARTREQGTEMCRVAVEL